MDEQVKQTDMIDTTDCLEAINVFKSMKNFMFLVIILCLLVSSAVFWADRAGWIDKSGRVGVCAVKAEPVKEDVSVQVKPDEAPATPGPVAEAAKAVTEQIGQAANGVIDAVAGKEKTAEQVAAAQASQEKVAPAIKEEQKAGIFERWRPKCASIMMLVKACNFILILAAALYSLTLLMSLKISLTGRLGGINHISRAFFISLFALVILMPWQAMLPGVVVGAVYLPRELLCGQGCCDGCGQLKLCWQALLYIRFVGLWAVVVWLYIWAQIRSVKWARATLRRLGIVR